MDVSVDYRDLFSAFNTHKVKYLVVGAYAVGYYAEPRFTKDLDVWVSADEANAARVYRALRTFGAPLTALRPHHFTNARMVYQIGVAPIRVDVLMGLPSVNFAAAWRRRRRSTYAGVPIYMISRIDLIRSKRRAGRAQDRLDLEMLSATPRRVQRRKAVR